MDSDEQNGGAATATATAAASEDSNTIIAELQERLDTKEELIQLKDARILELIETIQNKNKEIASKDEIIKALNAKLKEVENDSTSEKTPSRRGDSIKKPATPKHSEGGDNRDKSPKRQTKASTTTTTKSTRHQQNKASNGAESPKDQDLDDLPHASVVDDGDDYVYDNPPSLDGSTVSHSLDPKSAVEGNGQTSKKKASTTKKRVRAEDKSGTVATDAAAAKKPPRKRSKPCEKKESIEKPQKPWEESYQELVEFKQKFGLKKVPNRKEYPDLSRFHQNQRNKYNQYKQGEMPKDMTLDRIEKLEALGFAEPSKTGGQKGWEMRFKELKAFKEQNGHFRVSRHENYQLWGWIKVRQAVFYKTIPHETIIPIYDTSDFRPI